MNHAADVTSRQAYQDLQADTGAVLVDVRTALEWRSVGVPDVAGVVFAQWALGDRTANPRFLTKPRSPVGVGRLGGPPGGGDLPGPRNAPIRQESGKIERVEGPI